MRRVPKTKLSEEPFADRQIELPYDQALATFMVTIDPQADSAVGLVVLSIMPSGSWAIDETSGSRLPHHRPAAIHSASANLPISRRAPGIASCLGLSCPEEVLRRLFRCIQV